MSGFDKRQEGFEKKFAHDEELRFKASARRNKLFGLWAAEKLGKTGTDAEAYAKQVIAADFEEAGDDDVFRKVLETNTIAPFKLTEALMPSLRASSQKKVVTVSSGEGSLGSVNSARVYSYRASKAAVNMLMLNLAYEVKKDGVSVALLNPGPVATDMMKNAPIALRPVDDAAARRVGLIDRLTLENTGRFWDVTGVELPW